MFKVINPNTALVSIAYDYSALFDVNFNKLLTFIRKFKINFHLIIKDAPNDVLELFIYFPNIADLVFTKQHFP